MSKDAYYFSHDSNSRNDLKMVKLRRLSGMKGIGLFWCVIEMLRECDNYELDSESIEDICYELRVERVDFDKLFECELLHDVNGVFYSDSLKIRMQKLDKIKQIRTIAGSKGGRPKAIQEQKETKTKPNDNQMITNCTTSKVNKSIVKKIISSKEDKSIVDKLKVDGDFTNAVAYWFEFIEKRTGLKPRWGATEGRTMKSVLAYLKKIIKENGETDETPLTFLKRILDNWDLVQDKWMKKNCLDIKMFNSKVNLIINEIKGRYDLKEQFIENFDRY